MMICVLNLSFTDVLFKPIADLKKLEPAPLVEAA